MAIIRRDDLVPVFDPESPDDAIILKEGMTVGLAGQTKANILNKTGIVYKDKTGKGGGTEVFYSDIEGTRYYWDAQGTCLNIQDSDYNAVVVNSNISNTSAENAQVVDPTTGEATNNTASVKNLNARDSFAISALASLIEKHPEPINTDLGTINLLTKRAYEYATAMMVASAQLRAQDVEDAPSDDYVDIDVNSLTNVSDKLLNNIAFALSYLNENGVKVKNPKNNNVKDPLAIEGEVEGGSGGGGGTSEVEVTFNIDELKDALVNNLDYTTLNNTAALGYILGFYKNSSDKYIPTVNSLLELRQNIELNIKNNNNSLLHWLTKHTISNTDIIIENINNFLSAYGADISTAMRASLKSIWRAEFKVAIKKTLDALHTENPSIAVTNTKTTIDGLNVNADSNWQ